MCFKEIENKFRENPLIDHFQILIFFIRVVEKLILDLFVLD
ncbi:hypothetical protein LEP1GSC008_3493 [Leptospira kirschneri serovar Bulgarica str. Nikolaevo]|uniref:Uncharacterized protein n=1 Tax=Leptospira kirschneri serovar Bulgarica str. Nikolaevo TaxID=1240687 RepID=M6F2M0_9LEPT|nr:hypothetical protein LEP1GSC008_3493 [Leptospira kirschneri serovar Bulgarica str. Nikolaevo]